MFFEIKREQGEKVYTLFGKRIFRRRNLLKQMKWKMQHMEETLARMEGSLERLEKANTNLTALTRCSITAQQLPPAQGWLRDIQLAITRILKEIDRVCTQENITYWLDAGTALGAVRHGGFIPWDDDADLGMMRHDLERFLHVFPRVKSPELRVRRHGSRLWNLVKIEHAEIPSVCVDIFVYDFYNGSWNTLEERRQLTKIAKLIREESTPPADRDMRMQFFAEMTDRLMQDHPASPSDKPDVFIGLEFLPWFPTSIFFPYDAMLPTKRLKFEDAELCVPNDPHMYLSYFYGDYRILPSYPASNHAEVIQGMDVSKALALKEYISGPALD